MKAQLTFEYYAAIIVFALFIGYFFIRLSQIPPQFITELGNERLRSESYQISEILLNDPGHPINWTETEVQRIGLSSNINKTNLLSKAKIANLNTICGSDYENVRNLLGTEYQFSIEIIEMKDSANVLLNCEPPFPIGKLTKTSITRIISFDSGGFGKLIFEVW